MSVQSRFARRCDRDALSVRALPSLVGAIGDPRQCDLASPVGETPSRSPVRLVRRKSNFEFDLGAQKLREPCAPAANRWIFGRLARARRIALLQRMAAARHFSQLIVWKLAEEIRIEVFRLTARPRFAADFRARSQADDAANSVCRNIAEGFGCVTHAEFARFLEIARRSLNELHDTLYGAQLKGYVTVSDLVPFHQLSKRTYPAFSRLLEYLRSTPTPAVRTERPRRSDNRPDSNEGSHGQTTRDHTDNRKRIAPTRARGSHRRPK